MKTILYFFLLYFAFQFIFRVVVPLFIAGRQLRKGFKQMKKQMETQFDAQQNGGTGAQANQHFQPGNKPTAKPNREDYLEFEEIKGE